MRENIVSYNSYFFKKIWSELIKVEISNYTIPKYIRYIMMNCNKLEYRLNTKHIGVYNTGNPFDNEERSQINYIDTNYYSFTILINWINAQVITGKFNSISQIDFELGSYENEISTFFKALSTYRDIIFDPKSHIFSEMIKATRKTSDHGNMIEDITINKLKNIEGISDVKKGGFGDSDDMFKGIDVTFVYKNKKWTIQCKSFQFMEFNNDLYYIKGIGHTKRYDPELVNLYAFYNKNYGFLMFKNDYSVIINPNEYIFNKKLKKNLS